jgi:hypothetical protein
MSAIIELGSSIIVLAASLIIFFGQRKLLASLAQTRVEYAKLERRLARAELAIVKMETWIAK